MDEIREQDGADDTQVVFISVDPERDVKQHLKDYVTYFNRGFVGVTGPVEHLNALTTPLGVMHMRVDAPQGEEGYLIDHTASILLIDPTGHLKAIFGAPHNAQTIARNFHEIRRHHRSE
jgi:protein SCO1/2